MENLRTTGATDTMKPKTMDIGTPAYNVDWIFSNNSNVHVANHRGWFTKYTAFKTHIETGFSGGQSVEVEGIGDVELTTKTHSTRSGSQYQHTLVLHDVLYAPSVVCNILGGPILGAHSVEIGGTVSKVTHKQTGACIGLLDLNKLYRLRLRGQRSDQTSLDPGHVYLIRANWPPSEEALWEAFQRKQLHDSARKSHGTLNGDRATLTQTSVKHPQSQGSNAQLTGSEKSWLKDNYGGEFDFLRAHGLSIYKDEHREEGRSILRAMMAYDEDIDDDDEGSDNSFLREMEEDPSSHVADYHFSSIELDWIKAHYGYSSRFLQCHGLKFYDDNDCREGKAIVQARME